MSEWLKAVLSVVTGVAIGVALEPLKYRIQLRIKANQVRNGVYRELGAIWATLAFQIQSGIGTDPQLRFENLDVGDFEFYYAEDREAFNTFRSPEAIKELYREIAEMKNAVREGLCSPSQGAELLMARFSQVLVDGSLDEELFHKCTQRYSDLVSERNILWHRFTNPESKEGSHP